MKTLNIVYILNYKCGACFSLVVCKSNKKFNERLQRLKMYFTNHCFQFRVATHAHKEKTHVVSY